MNAMRTMWNPRRVLALACLGLLAVASAASAPGQELQHRGTGVQQAGPGILRLLPPDSVTRHTIELAGGKLSYTATAGTMPLYDNTGTQSAAIFYTAYVASAPQGRNRPVTFVFNGGPGAASVYLHLGLVGPRVLEFGMGGTDAATARLEHNPDTWLPFTDLVLIDPVGTGWSLPAKADGGRAFWGVNRDAEALAKFIGLYVARNGRSAAPKYILGESYGGFRAVKVARALQREQGIVVSGLILLSPLLEGAFQFGGDRFALGAALHFPSLAAAELERKGTFSKEAMAEAERFAMSEYLTTLAGPAPRGEAARAFYARIAGMTGLSAQLVERSRGFIRNDFVKQLRASEGKILSVYDAGFAADDPFPESGENRGGDPLLDGFSRAYSGAFAGYAREELGFKTDLTYVLLASGLNWDWQDGGGRRTPSVSDDMRILLAFGPSLRILIAHGYSDIVTPYGASRYAVDHLPPFAGPDRVALKLYRGGHMFYTNRESRRAFTAESRAFYQAAP